MLLPALTLSQQTAISTVVPLSAEQTQINSKDKNYALIMKGTNVSIQAPHRAIPIIKQAIDQSLASSDYTNVFQGYFALGAIHTSIGDYQKADQAYRQGLGYSLKTDNATANICRSLSNIGNTYIFQCNYHLASKYYFKAARLASLHTVQDQSTSDQLVRIYNNLGAALLQLNQFRKSIYYLNKAEILCTEINSPERLSAIHGNQAAVYNKLNMPDTAWGYGQKALALSRHYHKFHDEFSALINLATILISKEQPQHAILYLDTAFRIRGNIFPYYRTEALYVLGKAHLMLGNHEKARRYFREGQTIAQKTNATNYLFRIHQQMAILYARSNNYKDAFRHLQIAYTINDSTLNQEKTEAVNLLEVKYRTAEKDKELAQKQLQIKNQEQRLEQKNLWITATSCGSLILALLLAALYRTNQHKQRLQSNQIHILQQEQELLRKEQEINTLKAMMQGEEQERTRISRDLHDGVGSTLAAVKMNFTAILNNYPVLNRENKFSEAMGRLDDMYHELRQAAHNLTPEFLLQYGLADAIGLYCEQIGKGKSLEITFQSYGYYEGLPNDFMLNVYRIVQELVHNIVKHASATHAMVQLYQHRHLLSINVEDNGNGFDPESRKGIGFTNIRRRIKSINGRMNIEPSEKGTSVFLEFDVNTTHT